MDQQITFVKHVDMKIRVAKVYQIKLYPFVGRNGHLSVSNKINILAQRIAGKTFTSVVWANAGKTPIKQVLSCLMGLLPSSMCYHANHQSQFLRMAINIPYFTSTKEIEMQYRIESVQEQILNMANNF